jgi:hypothetical protein
MKKLIVSALAAMMFAIPAKAEDWVMVMEADVGTRLLVDFDSFGVQKWPDATSPKKQNIWLSAKFIYYGKDGANPAFVYTTKYDSCKSGNGELVHQEWNGTAFANKNRYWWSTEGLKMYDAGGLALCALARAAADATNTKSKLNGKDLI